MCKVLETPKVKNKFSILKNVLPNVVLSKDTVAKEKYSQATEHSNMRC